MGGDTYGQVMTQIGHLEKKVARGWSCEWSRRGAKRIGGSTAEGADEGSLPYHPSSILPRQSAPPSTSPEEVTPLSTILHPDLSPPSSQKHPNPFRVFKPHSGSIRSPPSFFRSPSEAPKPNEKFSIASKCLQILFKITKTPL
ncbi:hypothetical protein O3P69_005427 [Scylla paramamosain]|uniref:Uncharacterized protein n=1 Tax=Scylla paramamosain TaxID=85552 RepID=A0AAW0U8G8_SCYPA